ncbi:hypothetical protein B0T25DRAFT_529601 [Lasiosphaeria hispida]|uniref:Uncharacterized protein n=1 Tax=Lasiosphaeria hispida TaxID=260671 RepID=A0AAJ0HWK2_9PEZI|nr:hypothetical protein B0T25DRAFT_529601 [Lasiosphaeria hispida]
MKLDSAKYREHKSGPKKIVLSLSSIVMSTNPFGDFSRTTIVSRVIPGSKLKCATEKAQDLWRTFVHQPQTARCLVFLLMLEVLVEEIEKQYDGAADYLIDKVNLNDNLLGNEINKFDGQDSVETLKLIMWCLESLHKLQKSLDEAVDAVSKAKSEILAQICDKRVNKRSEALERVCQGSIEAFESRLLELEGAKLRIHHTVDLNRRQRDDTSTILQFYQNQNAFEQNKTIEKLAYLTIIYLPAGLMAAIFAIPETQSVVKESMGLGWFVFAIAVLCAATITVAVKLPELKGYVERVVRRPRTPKLSHGTCVATSGSEPETSWRRRAARFWRGMALRTSDDAVSEDVEQSGKDV